MTNNDLIKIDPKNSSVLAAVLTDGIDEIQEPVGGDWLPELHYAWPISQITDPMNTDKKGRPTVANHRLYIGDKTKPIFLGEGDLLIPVNARAALQIVETSPAGENLRYEIGIKNGRRKGAAYEEAVKLIEAHPEAKEAKKGAEPLIDDRHVCVNAGVSALLCVVFADRKRACFVEFPIFKKLFAFFAGALRTHGLRQKTAVRLLADDLSASLTEFEGKTWPDRKLFARSFNIEEITPELGAVIGGALEANASLVEDWATK